MFLSQRQSQAIATVLATIRVDWPEKSIASFLDTRAKALPFKDFAGLAEAAVMTAINPDAKTPAAILTYRRPGPSPDRPVHSAKCVDHPLYNSGACPNCTSEIKAGDRPGNMRGLHWEIPVTPQALPFETPVGSRRESFMDRSAGKD